MSYHETTTTPTKPIASTCTNWTPDSCLLCGINFKISGRTAKFAVIDGKCEVDVAIKEHLHVDISNYNVRMASICKKCRGNLQKFEVIEKLKQNMKETLKNNLSTARSKRLTKSPHKQQQAKRNTTTMRRELFLNDLDKENMCINTLFVPIRPSPNRQEQMKVSPNCLRVRVCESFSEKMLT